MFRSGDLWIQPELEEDVVPGIDDSVSRLWDLYWRVEIRRPFTWQRFLNWWAARRYVMPRDVRKR